jgi:hypothetical protein
MMGVQSPSQNILFHYGINLDKRIRANHPLRKVRFYSPKEGWINKVSYVYT